jgi:dolichol kinase
MTKIDKPRLLILAFNTVSVLLIVLEVLRHHKYLPASISKWFKELSNGRERLPETMIVTHIYLLMGCAFAPTCTYILLSGSVFTPEWALWSLSSLVFLGVGDTMAAVLGKMYGRTRWRETSSKTQEGSSYCIISVGLVYYVII